MANFINNAITDRGRTLLAHVQMGAVFTPTRIVIGSGYIPAGYTARTMTAVVTPVAELEITKKKRSNDGTCTFGGVYSNADITEDWYFRELALYAKAVYTDGTAVDECLYSYGNAGSAADLMPAYTSGTAVERKIDLITYIGNDAAVDLTVSSGLSISTDEKGAPGGVASLDADGKIPVGQLPPMDFVERAGDVMTGTLGFDNPTSFGALYKKRTIGDVDYIMRVGVGSYGTDGTFSVRLATTANDVETIVAQFDFDKSGLVWIGPDGVRKIIAHSGNLGLLSASMA